MFVWMMVPALAGELEVTVQTNEGVEEKLRIDQALACQESSYSTSGEAGRVKVKASVRPGATDDEWLVFLDVEGRRFGEEPGYQELRVAPAFRVKEGRKAKLTVDSQGHELELGVKVQGFDPTDCELLGRHVERRVRTERRERRETAEE